MDKDTIATLAELVQHGWDVRLDSGPDRCWSLTLVGFGSEQVYRGGSVRSVVARAFLGDKPDA